MSLIRPVHDGATAVANVKSALFEKRLGLGSPSISTGLKELDRAILGLLPKKMYVIAARPSCGKTALSATLRRSVLEQGYAVLDFSLEMGIEEISERELAYRSNVNLRKVMSPKELTLNEVGRVSAATTAEPGMWFIFDAIKTMSDIEATCDAYRAHVGLSGVKVGLVVIDYLQLLTGDSSGGRQNEVASFSRSVKLLSKSMDCAVVALSQLNRSCEHREDKRPMMSDIRESGAIEQDADVVAFLYRESMYDPSADPSETEFIIRKHRAGPTGTVKLHFNAETVSFCDVTNPFDMGDL